MTMKITMHRTITPTTDPIMTGRLELLVDDVVVETAHVLLLERHRKLFPSYLHKYADHIWFSAVQFIWHLCLEAGGGI